MAKQENEREEAMKFIQEWIPMASNEDLLSEYRSEVQVPMSDDRYWILIGTKGLIRDEILRRMAG